MDTLAPLLFIITLDYVLRTSIDEDLGLTLSKQLSIRYQTIKITDADYTDDLAIFADSSRNAEKLLNVLEESGKTVGIKVNIKKMQHMNIMMELDGTYTRILRAILNISCKEHPSKIRLYGNIPPLTSIIRIRRTRFAGHCYRSEK